MQSRRSQELGASATSVVGCGWHVLPLRPSFRRGMSSFYGRAVFFVADADRSLRHYTEQLGFSLDWDSKDGVFQVSLHGFELIINQAWKQTTSNAGRGRVFIGLDDDQGDPFRRHVLEKGIQTFRVEWGRPTLVIKDLDGNELFFWLPHDDFSGLGVAENAAPNP